MSPAGYSVARMGIDELLAQLDVGVDVLLVERILEPQIAHLLDRAADPERVGVFVAPRRVEHERVVVADGFAHGFAYFDIFGGVLRRVDLVGFPAVGFEFGGFAGVGLPAVEDLARGVGADRRAAGAEEFVEWEVGGLGGDVPQRGVAGTHCAQSCRALAGA